MTGTTADVARFVILALAGLAMGATAAVLRLHWRAYRAAPAGARLLPIHVLLIAASHITLIVVASGNVVDRINGPLHIRSVLFSLASLTTLTALWIIARAQRRRLIEARRGTP